MCTVSWRRIRTGYDLFFNRDELHSRAPEQPPALHHERGVKFLAPRDGDAGGTWLLTNEFGLTICLLNDYSNPWRPAARGPRHSRGQVVWATADARSLADVVRRVEGQPLSQVAPFWLLALTPRRQPLLLHWNGASLIRSRRVIHPPLLTSSSFSTAAVVAARRATFTRSIRVTARPTLAELTKFHRQHDPITPAHSVAMRRPDAATRSFIHVSVKPNRINFSYTLARWPVAVPHSAAIGAGWPMNDSAPSVATLTPVRCA